jgi:3-oxoacyl-[acyl-carrier protein] reductase
MSAIKKILHPHSSQASDMSGSLFGRVIIITGGSKGIGRAAAERLGKEGARLAISYSSDSGAADEVVKSIGPENCIAIKADAGSVAGAQTVVEETVKKYGRIDVLIANAGMLPMKELEDISEADFDQLFNINVKGVFFLIQASFQ